MELIKNNLSINRQKCKAVTYSAKEEAFNLSETLEDVAFILQHRGEVRINEMKAEENKVRVLGEIDFSVLYESASLDKTLCAYSNRMTFEEDINMEGLEAGDDVSLQVQLEELKFEIVNSRKIRVSSLVCLLATAEQFFDEEILSDVSDDMSMLQIKQGTIEYLNKINHIKEETSIESDFTVPSGQENIGKLVWYKVSLYNVEFALHDEQVEMGGDLNLFAVYQSENDMKIEFVQETKPFTKNIFVKGIDEGAMLNGKYNVSAVEVEVNQDIDGEDRSLHARCELDLDLHLYMEEEAEYVEDIYSVEDEVVPKVSMMTAQKLLALNKSKCRINDEVEIKKSGPVVLQLLSNGGKIKSVKITQEESGVLVEGIIDIQGMYVTSDDDRPFEKFEGTLPFLHFVEIPNMDVQSEYQVDIILEQMTVSLSKDDKIDVKALIQVTVLAYDVVLYPVIESLSVEKRDYEQVKKQPGIIGYVVKEDDTLWDIAKKYSTTVDVLKQINELNSEQLKPLDKLLIVKEVGNPIITV